MKKTMNLLLKKVHWAVFVCFLFSQSAIFHLVPAFGDDYYYGTFFRYGFPYFVSENNFHYFHTNGRALVHLIAEAVLADRSMLAFHIVGTLLVGATVFLLAVLASDGETKGLKTTRFRLSLILSCALFSGISKEIARQSIYWATGMLNYFLPIPFLLLGVCLMRRLEAKGKNVCPVIPLFFFAAWSTEQCGAAAVAFAALPISLTLINGKTRRDRKPKGSDVLLASVTLVGFLLLLLAPGNRERMTYYPEFYAKPLLNRIVSNVPIVANGLFSPVYMGTALALLLTSDGFAVLLKKENRKKSFSDIAFAVLDILGAVGIALIPQTKETPFLAACCFAALAAFVSFLARHLLLFLQKKERADTVFCSGLALVLQLCMLLSPEYGGRTVLCSVILLFIPILDLVCDQVAEGSGEPAFSSGSAGRPECHEKENARKCPSEKRSLPLLLIALASINCFLFGRGRFVMILSVCLLALTVLFLILKKNGAAVSLALLLILLGGLDTSYSLYQGYRENAAVHIRNEKQIAEWRQTGDESAPLTLYYLINGEYKHTMPYENTYHLYWYKKYLGLPIETQIDFCYYTDE